jgi:hypothetical protein
MRRPRRVFARRLSEAVMRTLLQCEAVIERGLASYREVGAALKEIRDRTLYRETPKYAKTGVTFEDYCQDPVGLHEGSRQPADPVIRRGCNVYHG